MGVTAPGVTGAIREAGARTPGSEIRASTRHVYLDNLKVVLIAGIIAIHGVLGYSGTIDTWLYTAVREVTLAPVTEAVMFVVGLPFGVVLIALLFLAAGLLTPPALERRGPGAYVRGRLLRLGVPFAVFVLLVQPTLMYALERPLGVATGSWAQEFLDEGRLEAGPLWFVGVLLIFSLAYAGWAALRHRPARLVRITQRQLFVIAATVAPASFLIRLVYPYGSDSGFWDLNFWEWPACIAAFALGIVGSQQGWLSAVPDRLRRQSRTIALTAVAAMAVFLFVAGSLELPVDTLMGGWSWTAAVFAVVETTLTVFGSVWLLGVAQRRLAHRARWGPAVSRSAYGAFMVQAVVLIGLAVALRPVPLPAEVKALIVAAGGVAGSFALAWLLISRVPVVARIL